MQSFSRSLVVVFAALLGVLPALRAGCDLDCGPRPVKPASHCSNQEPAPTTPVKGCGHDHSSTGTLTHSPDASPSRGVAVAMPVTVGAPVPSLHQQVSLWTIASVRGTPPIASSTIQLRI